MRERLLRILLRLLTREVREQREDELLEFWALQSAEVRYRGWSGRFRYHCAVAVDALRLGARSRVHALREVVRMSWSTELRHAIRSLRGSLGFTWTAVGTLTLGVASTTLVFSVVEAVVLRPLSYPDAHELVVVHRSDDPAVTWAVSWPDFADWRSGAPSFQGMAAYNEAGESFEWDGGAEALTGANVTRDYFDVFGVPLALGRSFSEEEDRAGGPEAIVLSHEVWMSRFQGDPNIIGRTVALSVGAVPVVGVAAPGFVAPFRDTQYWMPLQEDQILEEVGLPRGGRGLSFLTVVGRLRPGAAVGVAQTEIRALATRIDESVGKRPELHTRVTLEPLHAWLVDGVRETLWMLLFAAILVLFVATTNVLGLAVGRASSRGREMAVRAALGAGRARLALQSFLESALLAGTAGVFGGCLAWVGQDVLLQLAPDNLPRAAEVGMSPAALVFVALVTAANTAVLTMAPTTGRLKDRLSVLLRGGRGSNGDRGSLRVERGMVSLQFSIVVVLLTGAALLTTSFRSLMSTDRGFEAKSVVVATVAPPESRYTSAADLGALYDEILESVGALPGVRSVSTTYSPPLFGNAFRTSVAPEGAPVDPADRFYAGTVIIGGDYFEANGVPLLAGRDFTAADALGEPLVAIVNESMAEAFWPGQDPIGQRFEFTGGLGGSADSFDRAFFPDEAMTVVGVAGDVRRQDLGVEPEPEYYRPHAQIRWGFQYVLARVDGDVSSVAGRMRDVIWSVDASIPVETVTTLRDQVLTSLAAQRFRMVLLLTFAAITGVLAVVGLYAVMTLAVGRRVREMGIRMALGARSEDVVRGILGDGARLIVAGSAVGLVGAVALGSSLDAVVSGMLHGVEVNDARVYLGVILTTAITGLLAAYGPARRAGRVPPSISLRED